MQKFWKVLWVVIAFCLSACGSATASAVDLLTVHYLDVGQADAAILQCGDVSVMIDGGNSTDSSLVYTYLSQTLSLEHIDVMIATHPHEDHVGGLSGALEACTVGSVYSPVTDYDSKAFDSFLTYTARQNVPITVPSPGDRIELGDLTLEFLSPVRTYEDTNDNSLVVRILHGQNVFLFAGDAQWDAEHDMIDAGYDLRADVLKVGHHGSDTSSSYVFLREVMPTYAVISVGEGNAYGHPTEAVLSRLRDVGATLYRTDLQGTITCISDGETLSFSTQRRCDASALWLAADTLASVKPGNIPTAAPQSSPYIGNRNTGKFHYADCASVDDMKESNKVPFDYRESAISQGYVPCKRCNP